MRPFSAKAFFLLAAPMILSRAGLAAMGVADGLMVARFQASEFAWLSLAEGTLGRLLDVFVAFLIGALSLAPRLFARGDAAGARLLWLRTVPVALLLGCAGLAAGLCGPALLAWIGQSAEFAAGAGPVMAILGAGYPAALLAISAAVYLEGAGHPKFVAACVVAANVLNVALNWLLISGGHFGLPPLGARGSAYSTTSVRLALAAALFGVAWKTRERLGVSARTSEPHVASAATGPDPSGEIDREPSAAAPPKRLGVSARTSEPHVASAATGSDPACKIDREPSAAAPPERLGVSARTSEPHVASAATGSDPWAKLDGEPSAAAPPERLGVSARTSAPHVASAATGSDPACKLDRGPSAAAPPERLGVSSRTSAPHVASAATGSDPSGKMDGEPSATAPPERLGVSARTSEPDVASAATGSDPADKIDREPSAAATPTSRLRVSARASDANLASADSGSDPAGKADPEPAACSLERDQARKAQWRLGSAAAATVAAMVALTASLTIFAGWLGVLPLAAFAAAWNVAAPAGLAALGLSDAAGIQVASAAGRSAGASAADAAWASLRLTALPVAILAALLAAGSGSLAEFYAADPQLRAALKASIPLVAGVLLADSAGFVMAASLRAVRDAAWPAAIEIGSMAALVPLAAALAFWQGLGVRGLLLASLAAAVLRASALAWRFQALHPRPKTADWIPN